MPHFELNNLMSDTREKDLYYYMSPILSMSLQFLIRFVQS